MTRRLRRIRTLVLALLAACEVAGCAYLQTPAPESPAGIFACKVGVLAPYVGDVYDTEQLVQDALASRADVETVLRGLGSTASVVQDVAEAWMRCDPETARLLEPLRVQKPPAGVKLL